MKNKFKILLVTAVSLSVFGFATESGDKPASVVAKEEGAQKDKKEENVARSNDNEQKSSESGCADCERK